MKDNVDKNVNEGKGKKDVKLLLILVAAVVVLNLFTVIYFAGEMSKQPSCNAPINNESSEQIGCSLGGIFSCGSYSIMNSGIVMQIKSSDAILLKSLSVAGCGTAALNKNIEADTLTNVIISCSKSLSEGEDFEGNIVVKYSNAGESEEKQASGKINAVVEAS